MPPDSSIRLRTSCASGGRFSSRHSSGKNPRDFAAAFFGVRFAGLRLMPDFAFFAVTMIADIIADSRRDCKIMLHAKSAPALRPV